MLKLPKNLSQSEFEQLKEYIFRLQKQRYKRIDLKRKIRFTSKRETNRLMYDFLLFIIRQAEIDR